MTRERTLLDNIEKLREISSLEDGWSGPDSSAIGERVLAMAKNIVQQICHQPVIYPTGRGTIQMQFEQEDRSYLELEIFEEKIVCMKVPQRIYAEATFEVLQGVDMRRINRMVSEFYGE